MSDPIPMTAEIFHEIATVNCPYCSNGNMPKQRPSTGEWTHDLGGGAGNIRHTICLSSRFRNSRFAQVQKP